ncbi:MAG: type I methionyl aminopeptidase [Deltaproteobacteria bacterium]|nr:type I methionyl aminopeptidase [Deltaproteobacteria bacterium]
MMTEGEGLGVSPARKNQVVYIKSPEEISKIRRSGRLASQTLDYAASKLKAGMTTKALDKLIHEFIVSHKATPATLNYNGFPASSCISINEEVCHGIPGKRVIMDGDIVKIDVTTILDGYFGDTCRTFTVGTVDERTSKLVAATLESLDLAIRTVRNGSRLGDIGYAIQSHVEPMGFSVVRKFVGHGVGREFHEPPNVPHYGDKNTGMMLKTGMVLTIEPMINTGTWKVRILDDDWTVVTADGGLSAQFEHTLAVTDDGCEVLTGY